MAVSEARQGARLLGRQDSMVGVEVKDLSEGPMPGRPLKGLGLPPEGAGEPRQSLEQGKDRLRFVR